MQDLKAIKHGFCSQTWNGYIEIRLRFFDTYRRDVLNDPTANKTENIGKENAKAHNGDANTNAKLFHDGSAYDDGLMMKIYGMSAAEVIKFREYENFESISVIDKMATLKCRGNGKIPEQVDKEWLLFKPLNEG